VTPGARRRRGAKRTPKDASGFTPLSDHRSGKRLVKIFPDGVACFRRCGDRILAAAKPLHRPCATGTVSTRTVRYARIIDAMRNGMARTVHGLSLAAVIEAAKLASWGSGVKPPGKRLGVQLS